MVSTMAPRNSLKHPDSSSEVYSVFGEPTTNEPRSALGSATSQPDPDVSFVSPDNAENVSIPAAASISETPTFSKTSLQYDEVCMTSSTLRPLLQTIWDYSSAQSCHPAAPVEEAAGHRYWLPNGSLADEWVYFFQLAPDRFFDMAPESVRAAFKMQTHDSLLVGPSFSEAIQTEEIEHEAVEAEATFSNVVGASIELHPLEISSQVSLLQPPREDSSGALPGQSKMLYSAVSQGFSSHVAQPPSRKRRRDIDILNDDQSVDGSDASSHERIPKRTRRATVNSRGHPSSRQDPRQNRSTSNRASGPASTDFSTPTPTSVFPLLSDPTGAVAFIPDQESPPIVAQLLQSHGVHPPMKLPGGSLPTGSQSRAWSAQRIRAWVEIENMPMSRLPSTAFSAHGNEMTNFRTPESIDPRCCPFDTSIEENLAYFPNTCTINREMCFRASQHWTPMMMARYINYAHDVQTDAIVSRSKIAYQVASMNAFTKKHPGLLPTASLQSNSTESGLKAPNNKLHDYFLFHMGDGVVRPPTGRQAQMLTRVIEHVRNVTGDRNVRLSQAATYAQTHGITVPAQEQMDFTNLDAEDKPSLALIDTAMSDYRNKFDGCDP